MATGDSAEDPHPSSKLRFRVSQRTNGWWQRFNDWLAYGALGPILVLAGIGGIWNDFYALGIHRARVDSPNLLNIICTGAGLFSAACGLAFILRPRTPWWIAIVGVSPIVVANLVLGFSVYRVIEPAEWVLMLIMSPVIVVGVGIYGHHCHRPVYGQSARR